MYCDASVTVNKQRFHCLNPNRISDDDEGHQILLFPYDFDDCDPGNTLHCM